MEKECANPDCKKIFNTEGRKKYCNYIKCSQHVYYLENKEIFIERTRIWNKLNPERRKVMAKIATDKFRTEKRDRFNELLRRSYRKNKPKHRSRYNTRAILNGGNSFRKYNPLKKVCECGSIKDIEIHHEIYPITAKDIIRAIDDGKIYYKCRKCHGRGSGHTY